MKRIVTIQDISCVGKCSLTVALPIISAMGVETAVVPTAVLSTHTAFKDFTFRDLTEDITAIAEHWKKEAIDFDAIYTGYLGSFEQLELVSRFMDDFKTRDNIIFIDPVMADNGKLYTGFTQEFADRMATLCRKADVIVPNLTEASFMLGIPYPGEDYDEAYIKELLIRLSELGAHKVVLTGVSFDMSYNTDTKQYFSYFRERIPVNFHGTGDVFSSCCLGALMKGYSLEDSLKIAVDYTVNSIQRSVDNPSHRWYGVDFESALPSLIKRLEKC